MLDVYSFFCPHVWATLWVFGYPLGCPRKENLRTPSTREDRRTVKPAGGWVSWVPVRAVDWRQKGRSCLRNPWSNKIISYLMWHDHLHVLPDRSWAEHIPRLPKAYTVNFKSCHQEVCSQAVLKKWRLGVAEDKTGKCSTDKVCLSMHFITESQIIPVPACHLHIDRIHYIHIRIYVYISYYINHITVSSIQSKNMHIYIQ